MDHRAWQEMDKYKIQLREDMKRRKLPYLAVEVFNTQQPEGQSAMDTTATHFECLVNTLVSSWISNEESSVPLNMLSYLTNQIISMGELSAGLLVEQLGIPQEELKDLIQEVRKSVLGDFDLPDVPQAFTDAFNEGEDDDSSN